jgi:hypothetical protein
MLHMLPTSTAAAPVALQPPPQLPKLWLACKPQGLLLLLLLLPLEQVHRV